MLLAIEIILVLGAFTVMVSSGVSTVKSAMRFGRTTRRVAGDIQPKTLDLMSRADEASRRALGISDMRDQLLSRMEVVRVSLAKLMVSLRAVLEIRQKVSRVLEYIGL